MSAPSPLDAARAKFLHGVQLVNQGNDPAAALAEFAESYRLLPTFVAGLNVAVCLRELGRNAEALDQLDALVSRFERLPAEQRASLDNQRARLLERVGELEVRASEPGTSIVLDGTQRGESPLAKPLRLDIGVHMLRLSRDGFQTTEQLVTITPGRKHVIEARLAKLSGVGTLAIEETGGGSLDVLLDGAIVGRTPWRGSVSVGLHSVRLRDLDSGTAPISVDIQLKQNVSLSLRAVRLDAAASIEPTPAGSAVYIDGVFAGNGSWTGALPAGPHRFDVVAPGYRAFHTEVTLRSGARQRIVASLPLESSRQDARPLGLYVEPSLGLLFARSLRGSTDAACDCFGRSRPFGFLASGRVGYDVYRRVAVELAGGYLQLAESADRHVALGSDAGGVGFHSDDLQDKVSLAGPYAVLSVAARFFSKLPVITRVGAGAALLSADTSTTGTARGQLRTVGEPDQPASGTLAIDEPSRRLLTPFVSTEIRLGGYLTPRISLSFGVSATLFLPPAIERKGRRGLASGSQSLDIGPLRLADEPLARPFVALSPSVAGRYEL